MNAPYCEGPLQAKIAFIGEAPGAEEEKLRRPFVGTAGRLFNDLLRRAGIQRHDVYIDNVFQERPANNQINLFADLTKKVPLLTPIWNNHVEKLKERLEASEANVFVCLGNTPLYALTGLREITKRRGSILESTLLPGRKVIPCIHPSSALRQYLHQYLIIMDMTRAKEQSEFPEIQRTERSLLLNPGFQDVMDWLSDDHHWEFVAFDIEVKFGEVSHISFAPDAHNAICIPFVDGVKDWWAPDQEAAIWKRVAEILENEEIRKVGQNVSFDATFLYRKYGIHAKPLDDTMIAQAILYPDFPKGLDFITASYCAGEPYYKDEGKEWFKNPFASEEIFRNYSAMDSAVVAEAFPKMMADLEKQGNFEAYKRQCQLIHPLVYIGEKGIPMDTEGLAKESKLCDAKIEALQTELREICGFDLNPASVKQVKAYFYVQKGLKPYTKQGSVTVDDKALKRIAAKGHREAIIILELRHQKKMKGTYFDMKLDDDGRLRCSYNPVGTKQGRISSSKTIFGTGGNLQNQPPEMQSYMHADPGYIAISMDLGQAENRVVAYIANERAMIHAFEQKIDIHNQTAAMILEKDITEVTKDERGTVGKRANHGLNYDLGYRTFAIYYQIPEREAAFIVERYHQIYPGVREWHASIREELSKSRTLRNCFGRKRTFMDRWGHELFKEAYSYIPQSTV
ncbi:hypothetical protein HN911_13305, partial [Candidatus Bathyarchaeota archaeon]|nr:hypothetical protein [Candidatus Bathyarchaeota archaeon]